MGKVNREMEILIMNQKEMLEIKLSIIEMRKAFNELTVDWSWLRKESLSSGYLNINLPNWKAKRIKT